MALPTPPNATELTGAAPAGLTGYAGDNNKGELK